MKRTICQLFFAIAVLATSAIGQTATSTPDLEAQRREVERIQLEARIRAEQARSMERLRAIAKRMNPDDIYFEDGRNGISAKYSPTMGEEDIRAISILSDDLKTYHDFLRSSGTGIVRLQNADICSPNDLVIRVSAGCANNVKGKATGYSFRERGYRSPLYADIFFMGGKLSKKAAFVIGLFSDLGTVEITKLSLSSQGVRQLVEFRPPNKEEEIERQYAILKRGAAVAGHVYGPEVKVVVGNTYVLRSVAYQGKIEAGSKPNTVDVLADDERKDVTVVFKVLRQLGDGSIVLLWKELDRRDPPNIVLEAKAGKGLPAKNEFAQ